MPTRFLEYSRNLRGVNVKRAVLVFVSCIVLFQLASEIRGFAQVAGKGKSGHFRVDYAFTGQDGGMPVAPLIEDSSGNLYGTASTGGGSNLGVVFKIDTSNNETVLHAFSGPDGATPYGGLVRDTGGNLYGTTF